MNRARVFEEDIDTYHNNLSKEARAMKFRLKGRLVWRTFYPIDSMNGLPKGAVVMERDEDTGAMVATSKFDPEHKQHFIKFPPYVAPVESKRLTFSQQRKLIDESIEYDSEGLDEGSSINDDTGGEG